jgi:hypothetical protein
VTIQASDDLIYEGVPCRLKSEMRLPHHARLIVVSDDEARAALSVFCTTACWRNFVAVWEIREGRMYLNEVAGMYRLEGSLPLAADWVNDDLEFEEVEVITDFWDVDYSSGVARSFAVQIRAGVVRASNYAPRRKDAA